MKNQGHSAFDDEGENNSEAGEMWKFGASDAGVGDAKILMMLLLLSRTIMRDLNRIRCGVKTGKMLPSVTSMIAPLKSAFTKSALTNCQVTPSTLFPRLLFLCWLGCGFRENKLFNHLLGQMLIGLSDVCLITRGIIAIEPRYVMTFFRFMDKGLVVPHALLGASNQPGSDE